MVFRFGSDGQVLLEIEDLTELHSDDGLILVGASLYSWQSFRSYNAAELCKHRRIAVSCTCYVQVTASGLVLCELQWCYEGLNIEVPLSSCQ